MVVGIKHFINCLVVNGCFIVVDYASWIAGLWDGDGSRYVIRRKSRPSQVDYYVKISSSSFLETKIMIEVFHRVFGFYPYNVRALLRRNRKHYVFEIRCDSRKLFEWFDEKHLYELIDRDPLSYISGFFWAEGTIHVDSRRKKKIIHVNFTIKPDEYKKNPGKFHRGTYERIIYALEKIRETNYSGQKIYRVNTSKSGRNKGLAIITILNKELCKRIVETLPCNWRIFKWFYLCGGIGLLEYVFAYALDYCVFNRFLGRVLSRSKKYPYGCFDTWFFRRIVGADPGVLEESLARGRSIEKLMNVFHRLGINDYNDILGYARACYEEFLGEQETNRKKLLGCVLENVYGGSAKTIVKASLPEVAEALMV